MQLQIDNKIILTPVDVLLKIAKAQTRNGKLHDIKVRGDRCMISCPCHKNGLEMHPSCSVNLSYDSDKLEPGKTHCFTCGYKANFVKLVADIFDCSLDDAKAWILRTADYSFAADMLTFASDITFEKPETKKFALDERCLEQYDFYHPYMWERKLSKEVVDQFRVGYDHARDAITFPVYDEKHNLVMVTARSVNTKRFYIPEDVEKPVYLLYDILDKHITEVFVVESQINALYLRSLGYNAIGLFGTGSRIQLELLKKSGIRSYYLCFDGDDAGRKGAARFKKALGKDVFITEVRLPEGKDVNDLSKDEFESLLRSVDN